MPATHPTRDAIEAAQFEHLGALLAELIPANRFYTRKLQEVGLGFDVASLRDFSARFPFTLKDELVRDQEQHPPTGTNLTYPLDRYTRFHQTSGTTGRPLRWLDTAEDWDALLDCWVEVFKVAGVGRGDRVFFAFSFGPFLGFWMAFESAERLGCLCLPGGGLSSTARLKMILDNEVTVLCCTPSYALRLGEVAAEEGLNLGNSKVRVVVVAGEPGGSIPGTRQRIEACWPGARVFDHHGMTEVGPVTYECPVQPGVLHVIESGYYAEIIDPATGQPLPAGETGEMVLTPLLRTGSPLLRYRTGDLVKRGVRTAECGTACECGRNEMALEGGILGRVDDMVIVRGVNVHPSAVEGIVRSMAGVAEFQVRLTRHGSLTEIRVVVEPSTDCANPEALASRLGHAFESSLSLRVPVELAPLNALPRYEMKANRWIRE
jgi:phenylacetate-CoA ligase